MGCSGCLGSLIELCIFGSTRDASADVNSFSLNYVFQTLSNKTFFLPLNFFQMF